MEKSTNLDRFIRRSLLTDQQILMAYRFIRNPKSFELAPTLFRILMDVLVHDVPLEDYEQKKGWPARSAKAIVGQLLFALQEIDGSHEVISDQVRDLRDQIRELKSAPQDGPELLALRNTFGLTLAEAALVETLRVRAGAAVTKQFLHDALYSHDPNGGPEIKIIDVMICRARRKLEGSCLKIETERGYGYRLIETPTIKPKSSDMEVAA